MNTNVQSQNSAAKNPTNGAAFTQSDVKNQLKTIGDQIEAIAKRLEAQGSNIDCEGLYEMGDKIEHFMDNVDAEKLIAKPSSKDWEGSQSAEKPSFASFDKKANAAKDKDQLS